MKDYVCVYRNHSVMQIAYFDSIEEFEEWADSALEYGAQWAHLIGRTTGNVVCSKFAGI